MPEYGAQLLTLSTCGDTHPDTDARFALLAVRWSERIFLLHFRSESAIMVLTQFYINKRSLYHGRIYL